MVPVNERYPKRRNSARPVVAAGLLLLVGSALPIPERFNPNVGPLGPDKFLHFIGHAVFTTLFGRAFVDDGRDLRVDVLGICASSAYGLGTELLQRRIPTREFERGDVVAGFLGSIAGVLAVRYVEGYRRCP